MTILLAETVRRKDHGENSIKLPGQVLDLSRSSPPASWGRSIPGEELTTPEFVFAASQQLVAAGLSVIPIEAYEGSKSPDACRLPRPHDPVSSKRKPSWSIYQIRRPTPHELRQWYERGTSYGLAVIGGTVSGGQYGCGLEVIDFDHADLAGPWKEKVDQRAPGLVDRLVRVQTPRPGLHCYYRCSRFGVSQKLALGFARDDGGQQALDPQGHPVRKTLIEVKAEGGYCLIPPSPPRCHPTGRLYQYVEGSRDLTRVPTITPAERDILLDAARSLSQCKEPKQETKPRRPRSKSLRKSSAVDLPGDDFDARGNWADILTPHGWVCVSEYADERRWCRPGKGDGVSATTNYQGNDLLHVFTCNAPPLEADVNYTKFAAYTWLNHGGDFTKAARDLREQGYGKTRTKSNNPLMPQLGGLHRPLRKLTYQE